ncbi:cysteine desulfurase NifS [Bradyrhizobium sp. SZCCHNR1098]|uniref:cysteine desulfurase NifS n=1 Tax=Bradyrhizobium sp. SZCCHNR1098 TaxID=3057370 RepID=UPI0029170BFD|nr:cysteine desulfurase NifS [Bradyrhizobium sp. SZCCHNR1098]
MRPVYLDNNATTRADPEVVAAMLPFFSEQFGNASSSHAFGSEVASAVRQARKSLQALLGAVFEHEIVFTSGGTESDNSAILSALQTQSGRDEIVTTAVEHPAILSLVEYLRDKRGLTVHLIGVDAAGCLDLEAYKRALGPRTAIASVMWANNETGTLFPIPELAKLAHDAGALFHTDAVQAVGKVAIDLKAAGVDMLSLSGHKLHGPKGIGALYVRKGTPFAPLVRGGPQERRRRGGTENVPAIIGLGKAADLAGQHLADEQGRVRALRDRLEQGIIQDVGHCAVLGDIEHRLPNTLNIAFQHLEGEPIVMRLNQAGIAASLGSACASGSMEPSHVLRAMNVPSDLLRGAVRFSLSRDTTDDDITRVLQVLPDIVARLRETSPAWLQHHPSQSAAPLRSTELT